MKSLAIPNSLPLVFFASADETPLLTGLVVMGIILAIAIAVIITVASLRRITFQLDRILWEIQSFRVRQENIPPPPILATPPKT